MPEQRPSYHRFHVWPSEIDHGKHFWRQCLGWRLILECIWLSFLNYPIGCVHEGLFLLSFTLKMRITTDRWIRFKDIKTLRFGELFLCFDIQSQLYFLEASFHFVKAYPADICIVIFFLFDHTLRSTRKYISDPITRHYVSFAISEYLSYIGLDFELNKNNTCCSNALDMPNTVRVCKVDWLLLYIRKKHSKTIFAPKLLRLKIWL